MAGKRHRSTARPSDKEVALRETKRSKKSLEPTSVEHYECINSILGFKVLYNQPTKRPFGYSSFAVTELPFLAFPVLTREPPAHGVLPDTLPSGDLGYFLGAADPSDICTAIIEAYMTFNPNANPKSSPWKNWEVFINNRAYYGTPIFDKTEKTDITVLANSILSTREFGGTSGSKPAVAVARVMNQKKYLLAVYLCNVFATTRPEHIPPDTVFFTKQDLSAFNASYLEYLTTVSLPKKDLARKIGKIADSSSDESSDEEDSASE